MIISSIAVFIEVRNSIQHSLPGGFLIFRELLFIHAPHIHHEPLRRIDQSEDELVILTVIYMEIVFLSQEAISDS